MSANELLEQALKLKPDAKVDEIWLQEAEARLQSHREGKLDGIPMEEIFRDE